MILKWHIHQDFSYVCIIQFFLTVLPYEDGDYKYMYLLPNTIKYWFRNILSKTSEIKALFRFGIDWEAEALSGWGLSDLVETLGEQMDSFDRIRTTEQYPSLLCRCMCS